MDLFFIQLLPYHPPKSRRIMPIAEIKTINGFCQRQLNLIHLQIPNRLKHCVNL